MWKGENFSGFNAAADIAMFGRKEEFGEKDINYQGKPGDD